MSTSGTPTIRLKPGHVRPIWAGHPWVFAQAVESVTGNPGPGEEVLVVDSEKKPLGRGLYSPRSALRVRLFTTSPTERLDSALLSQRLTAALRLRERYGLPSAETDAFRWVFSEGDNLPGLVVDLFRRTAVVQFGTVGMAARRELVVEALLATGKVDAVLEQSSSKIAKLEGFDAQGGLIGGSGPESLLFEERGFTYHLPQTLSQKTGFYLDQRPLRDRIERLSKGQRVLDTYSYVGPASLAAARGGATRVVAVDSSEGALAVLADLAQSHGHSVEPLLGDAFRVLEDLSGERFDLVICDPPKLSPSRASLASAEKLMRRLVSALVQVLSPEGILVISSCSAAVEAFHLTRAVAIGARDRGRRAVVLERVFQGPDHPVPAAFPEGLYLSSVIAKVS